MTESDTPTESPPTRTESPPKAPRRGFSAPWWIGLVVAGFGGFVLFCFGMCIGFPCLTTGVRYGMWIDHCPVTDLRLGGHVDVSGVVRGGDGTVSVLPYARYMRGHGGDAWVTEATMYRGVQVHLDLLDAEGELLEGMEVKDRKKRRGRRKHTISLPALPDGDYILRAKLYAPFESVQVDVDLPLYAPAIAHVMTDRPLYKPGQEVLLRSVTLKRTDLSPLEGRPGRWRITSPDGTEMLLEKDRAAAYGVADSTFPLDSRAPVGTWTAQWLSGEASDSVTFEVRPFKLPRFTVDLSPSARWYGIGDKVRLEGKARYTSGAPVANAPVELRLHPAEGRWPMPLAWEEPVNVRTDDGGSFEVTIGTVPSDLIERNVLAAAVRVTEEAGEVATGGTRVILSKDDLMVEAVTELGDGLVGGFNNRAYLRVSTPDNSPLPLADVVVSNPWDTRAKAREAKADEDGVAALQLDPGDPVTVVIPAPPVRVRPLVPGTPSISSGGELWEGRSLDMAERRALDRAVPAVARCGDYAPGDASVRIGVRVNGAGTVSDVLHDTSPVGRCVGAAVRAVRFPMGAQRTYSLTWIVPDSLVPSFQVNTSPAYGAHDGFRRSWQEAAIEARRCASMGQGVSGRTVLKAHWRVFEESQAIESSLQTDRGTGLNGAQLECVRRAFLSARLDEEADEDAMGTASVSLSVPSPPGSSKPSPTATTGYELQIAAHVDQAKIGETRLVLPVGLIPPLRLRATPSLASPGDSVMVEMFRGPDFYGDLPEKVWLRRGDLYVEKAKVDEESRSVTYTLPSDQDGFFYVEVSGARAVIFVQPTDPLSVELATDEATYRPGATARLTVTTRAGDAPTPAGVGLSGVDTALAQLAPLLGPDDYGRVTVRATSDNPAFGAFDPRALSLGQVRGENAAKAAVLRISQLPMDPGGDERLYTSGSSTHDDVEVLITSFYRALEALHKRVRAWEKTAPEGETMSPALMVEMWNETTKALDKEGKSARDAFGRRLTLDILPSDLLAQVDPRQVVADGTRLPEDVIAWDRYVLEE
ncbi:MAG: hypothetical protein JRI25_15220, partial [Deltaproteobacteria bacterium]|nr:hypothetical protein [Deltaproteobacteria bacterium]